MTFAPPVPGARICSYQYEVRERPTYTTEHMGMDICGECGLGVFSPLPGRAKDVHTTEVGGLTVVVEHRPDLFLRYAHLERALVVPGQSVGTGQLIAVLGRSGTAALGCHLHFAATHVWWPPETHRIYREEDHLDLRSLLESIGITEDDRHLVWKPGYPKHGSGVGSALLLGAGLGLAYLVGSKLMGSK
jgi:murein DD-endopeptidase MepM/ murein hydrolase activator NlpD